MKPADFPMPPLEELHQLALAAFLADSAGDIARTSYEFDQAMTPPILLQMIDGLKQARSDAEKWRGICLHVLVAVGAAEGVDYREEWADALSRDELKLLDMDVNSLFRLLHPAPTNKETT